MQDTSQIKDNTLQEAHRLLTVWSVDDIMNFIPQIAFDYILIDNACNENEKAFDLLRMKTYLDTKKAKKEWRSEMSDKDIDIFAKQTAQEKFWHYNDNKMLANHYKLYMDLLKQKKIDLQTLEKKERETIWS